MPDIAEQFLAASWSKRTHIVSEVRRLHPECQRGVCPIMLMKSEGIDPDLLDELDRRMRWEKDHA